MERRIENGLAAERRRRGWSQARAAGAAGVTRQSYAAIESGASVPSTEFALRLARAWGRTVEDLFRLPAAAPAAVRATTAGMEHAVGGRVRLVRVAGRLVAYPAGGAERPIGPADAIVEEVDGAEVLLRPLHGAPPPGRLAVVGCDPAFGIVAEALRRERGIDVVWHPLGSRGALEALARGEAHVAGVHLVDARTGAPDHGSLRKLVPFACTRVRFAEWEQGLLVQPGNPAGIAETGDLARAGIRIVNREPGSGSRALLDERLARAAVPPTSVEGYTIEARGHLAVAEAVSAGLAHAGVGIRAAGAAFGLDVIPLRTERYDLVVPDHFLDLPAMGALLDTLRTMPVRAQVEALQGYDGEGMGLPA